MALKTVLLDSWTKVDAAAVALVGYCGKGSLNVRTLMQIAASVVLVIDLPTREDSGTLAEKRFHLDPECRVDDGAFINASDGSRVFVVHDSIDVDVNKEAINARAANLLDEEPLSIHAC